MYVYKCAFHTRCPLGHCRIGGRTYSKHTGHSKKLANSVEEASVVPDTDDDPELSDVDEVTLEIIARLLELILLNIQKEIS